RSPSKAAAKTAIERAWLTLARWRFAVHRFTVFIVALQIAWASSIALSANNAGHKNDDEQLTPERIKEITARLHKNLEASEDRLGKKDPGAATREIQEQILKDLDTLLKQQQETDGGSSQKSVKPSGRSDPKPQKKSATKASPDASSRPDAKAVTGIHDKGQT